MPVPSDKPGETASNLERRPRLDCRNDSSERRFRVRSQYPANEVLLPFVKANGSAVMFTRRVYQRDDVSAFTIALGTTNDSTHSDLVMRKDGDFPCQLLLHLDFTLREDGSLWEDGDCFQHQPPALRYQFVQMFSVLILTYNPLAGCLCAVPRRGAWSGNDKCISLPFSQHRLMSELA